MIIGLAGAINNFDQERHDIPITHKDTISESLSSTLLFSRVNKLIASPGYLERKTVNERLSNATLLHNEVTSAWDELVQKNWPSPEPADQWPFILGL